MATALVFGTAGGESYSRVFAIVHSRGDAGFNNDGVDGSTPHNPEEINPAQSADPTLKLPPINPTLDVPAVPSDTQSLGGGGGGTGLPIGAVIGIAIGCGVVGLAAIFALVWFLVRQHQRKKALLHVGSYAADNRAEDLMAEKEANAEADASPHSPYSDDGAAGGCGGAAALADTSAAAAAAAAAPHLQYPQQDQPRSFTPYSERPSGGGGAAAAGSPSTHAASIAHTDEARISVPSATPGRSTPRALTTPYAHLVEEGMTEEEIRRLEEEERQLDAAIEQAGRR